MAVYPEDWNRLWKELGVQENTDALFERLSAAYSEPHRDYHTLVHVEDCLNELERSCVLADHANEIRIAIWFHDAVYKPFATDNEARSAQMAEKSLVEAGISPAVADRVSDLILATKHPCRPKTADASLIVDIDLSILGKPPDIFDAYEENIRYEYKRVPWFIYRKKRAELLKLFLSQERIYLRNEFRNRYEKQAMENIKRSVGRLLRK
ncbi:hypothetical protein QUF80_04465 [Desulfococcaceae bacterium HSG8]|nr:hypothetical protein [Desulfococcaceae bacterium HSG8]